MNFAQDATKELWHERLGHMSEKGLEFLAKDHFPNIKGQPLESCEDYLAGKPCRVSFQRSDEAKRRKQILDLVHSDVCSMSEKSLVVPNTLLPSLMITLESVDASVEDKRSSSLNFQGVSCLSRTTY